MAQPPVILFTAFEPSGDEHAAPVIAELRRLRPEVPIYALGGPKMAEAGAQIIEQTTGASAMLGGAVSKVREQLALRRRLARWLDDHPVAVHVPTDSPAANWAICKMVKQRWATQVAGVPWSNRATGLGKVVHLVAPQVWAWASWRVARLRKWSDLVLCILPFEPCWFEKHGVRARFIGHPLFDHIPDAEALTWEAVSYPKGRPHVALLPGSRMGEITANWPLMLEAFNRLRRELPNATGMIAAAGDKAAARLRELTPELPHDVRMITGQMEAVLAWADIVLTVSGTATLHVARHLKPMAIVYKVNPASWHALGRWIIDTRTFTLPNLLAIGGPQRSPGQHIVREFVPFLGGRDDVQPIADELASLMRDDQKRQRQVEALRQILSPFARRHAGQEAAQAIAELL